MHANDIIASLERGGLHTMMENEAIPYYLLKQKVMSDEEWGELRGLALGIFYKYDPNSISLFDDDSSGYKMSNVLIISKWIEHILEQGMSVDDLPPLWKNYVLELSNKPVGDHEYFSKTVGSALNSYQYSRNYNCDPHVLAASLNSEFDWSTYFDLTKTENYYSRSPTSCAIVNNYARCSPDSFIEYMNEDIFSKNVTHHKRGYYYSVFVKNGLLTPKTARKIRSDPSSNASLVGLKALFDSKDSYSSFEDLVIKFIDSRYEDVTLHLAANLPIHMVSFLVGSDHWHTKRKVESRMEEFYSSKAQD